MLMTSLIRCTFTFNYTCSKTFVTTKLLKQGYQYHKLRIYSYLDENASIVSLFKTMFMDMNSIYFELPIYDP